MSWARKWGEKAGVCKHCKALIPPSRPFRALYCSNACKQRDYRKRQAEGLAKPKGKKK